MEVTKIGTVEQINQQSPKKTTNNKNLQTAPYPNDSVELSTKQKLYIKNSLIGLGISATAFIGMVMFIVKHQGNRIKKLYDKKLVIRNLQEKIDFKDAKTIEEGIKFTKEVLGIKNIDENFSLEAINIVNKGLVDISNAHKGKVFMPYALKFPAPRDKKDYSAAVNININTDDFGTMYINRYFFNEEFLNKELSERLFNNKNPLFEFDEKTEAVITPIWYNYIYANPSKEVSELIKSFYKEKSSLSLTQKRNLLYSLMHGKDDAARSFRNPIETLKNIEQSQNEFLEKNNIIIDYNYVSNLDYNKQKEYLKQILDKMKKEEIYLVKNFNIINPIITIYHEMGHLQDAAKNLKELDLKQWKFNWKEEWKNLRKKKSYEEYISRVGVDEVDNRWGSITKVYFNIMLGTDPKNFRKHYPDLYKFITDKQIQQTAGKVSSYAQTGIGEFVADSYAKMISGQKLPEDVMELYKKYKGPEFL